MMLCNKHLILPPGDRLDLNQSIQFILPKAANDSMLMRNEMACNLRQPAPSHCVSFKETAFLLCHHLNLGKKGEFKFWGKMLRELLLGKGTQEGNPLY